MLSEAKVRNFFALIRVICQVWRSSFSLPFDSTVYVMESEYIVPKIK